MFGNKDVFCKKVKSYPFQLLDKIKSKILNKVFLCIYIFNKDLRIRS